MDKKSLLTLYEVARVVGNRNPISLGIEYPGFSPVQIKEACNAAREELIEGPDDLISALKLLLAQNLYPSPFLSSSICRGIDEIINLIIKQREEKVSSRGI